MSGKLLAVAVLLLASSFQPLFADPTDVQVVATTVADNDVTLHIENTGTSTVSVRVQVAVRVADGSTELLTTAPVTVPGAGTAAVSVAATATVVEISDDPNPVSP